MPNGKRMLLKAGEFLSVSLFAFYKPLLCSLGVARILAHHFMNTEGGVKYRETLSSRFISGANLSYSIKHDEKNITVSCYIAVRLYQR